MTTAQWQALIQLRNLKHGQIRLIKNAREEKTFRSLVRKDFATHGCICGYRGYLLTERGRKLMIG